MTELSDFYGARAGRLADDLLVLCQLVVPAGGRQRISGELIELMNALHAASLSSDIGSTAAESETIDWRAPADAGQLVGVGARQVRQLASVGDVRSKRVGARGLLIDVADLHRHYREARQR